MNHEVTFVIAGNHTQFDNFLWENRLKKKDYRYIHDKHMIRGFKLEDRVVILYGTYYDHQWFAEVREMLIQLGAVLLNWDVEAFRPPERDEDDLPLSPQYWADLKDPVKLHEIYPWRVFERNDQVEFEQYFHSPEKMSEMRREVARVQEEVARMSYEKLYLAEPISPLQIGEPSSTETSTSERPLTASELSIMEKESKAWRW
jgi:hypothetical protein